MCQLESEMYKDKRKSELADLMAHNDNTAKKHYYIRKKQLSPTARSSSLREAVFKQTWLISSQVVTRSSTALGPYLSKSLSLSPKKVWNPKEVGKLRNIFKEEPQNNKVTLELVHEKLAGDETFNASVC